MRIVSALLLLALLAQPAVAAPRVLIIDYPDYWPFFSRQENGQMTGFFYEIVSEALGRLEVDTEWREFPWTRCQDNVRYGDAEAMITVPTPERLQYTATHPTPFYLKGLHFFTYAGHPDAERIASMQTIEDIREADLTVITYAGNGWHRSHVVSKGVKTYYTPYIKNVWQMLIERRGDIVIEWPMAAWAEIRKTGESPEKILQTDVMIDPMPFHLLISRQSPEVELLPEFERVILEMRESGRIAEILAAYTN